MTTPRKDPGAQGTGTGGNWPGYRPPPSGNSEQVSGGFAASPPGYGQALPPDYAQVPAGSFGQIPGRQGQDAMLAQCRSRLRWAVVGAILAGIIVVGGVSLAVITVMVGALDARTIAALVVVLALAGWRLTGCLSRISELRGTIRQAHSAMP